MKKKDDEMNTTETSSSTVENLASHVRDSDSVIVEENNFPSLVETTCDFTESSNSFAEISMELDHGDVGWEKEMTEDVEEEQLSLEQQIHSMLKKEKVPLTQAGIRYLCYWKEDVEFQNIWRELLGSGPEKRAFNKMRKFNNSKPSNSRIPEFSVVPWKGNQEKPSLESILGLPKYFESYPDKCKKDDVNVLLCKTPFMIILINITNLENVCHDNKTFEHAFNIFKDMYSGNIETLRSSLRKLDRKL